MKLGVCYYPEHWPEEQWATDAKEMCTLGIKLVRIGEFAWSRIEPREGEYDWDWLDRAIDTLADAGLEIVLGTPTATPPKWLIDKYPDVLPCDADGLPRRFGSRRHYSFSSATYRVLSKRVVTALVERYGGHPAIVLWQTDNEFGCHDTVRSNDLGAQQGFRDWLAAKYSNISALNAAWGTVFWSQEYRGFDEVDPPCATVTEANPSHVLDWFRYSSGQVAAFHKDQVDVIRSSSSDTPVTHNFMGHFTDFDHFNLSGELTIATWDSYPLGFLDVAWWDHETKSRYLRSGHPDFAAFHHDLYRRVGNGRFGVMEQQPGPVNWAPYNPAPHDGVVRLWTLEAAAHGAEFVSYFRWRQAPFAQEQMHAGLNRRDLKIDTGGREAQRCAADLRELGEIGTVAASVALVFDYEADWVHTIQPQGRSFRYQELVFSYYSALRSLGLSIDIVKPGDDLDVYKLVIVPSLPIVSDAAKMAFEKTEARLVFGPRSGSKTGDLQIPSELAPGPLQSLLPLKVIRVESLRPGLAEDVVFENEVIGTVGRWLEHIEADQLQPVMTTPWDTGMVWENERTSYHAGWFDAELLKHLMTDEADKAGLSVRPLPDGLRIRKTREYVFALNYSGTHDLRASKLTDDRTEFVLGSPVLERPGDVSVWRISETPSS